MNYSIIAYIIGWILNFEALFMALPCITAISTMNIPAGHFSYLLCSAS